MLNDNEWRELTTVFPVLLEAGEETQLMLREAAVSVHAPPGSVMFDVGNPCEAFPMLVRGTVRVFRRSATGREILLYRVGGGDFCVLNTTCALSGAEFPAAGVVEEEIFAAKVDTGTFWRAVMQCPALRSTVFRTFGERLYFLMSLVDEVAFQRLDQRLAKSLLGRPAVARVTHQQLADELGTVREIVSRIVKEWESRGIVRLARGQIETVDRQQLDTIAAG